MSSRYGFRENKASGLWTPDQKPPFGATLIPDHPLNRGLVGCWLFNEGGGNIAFDLSGNGNHGTLTNGPAWVGDPQCGQAISFDGSDDTTQTNSPAYPTVTGLTVLARILTAGLPSGGYFRILSPVSWNPGFILAITTGTAGKTSVYLWDDGEDMLTGNVTVNTSSLTHLGFTWEVSGAIKIYVNGTVDNSKTGSSVNTAFTLGPKLTFADRSPRFCGFISDSRVYLRALSAAEIWQLYNEPFCMFQMPSRVKYFLLPNYLALNIKANFAMLRPKIAFSLKRPEVNFSLKKAGADFEMIQ